MSNKLGKALLWNHDVVSLLENCCMDSLIISFLIAIIFEFEGIARIECVEGLISVLVLNRGSDR